MNHFRVGSVNVLIAICFLLPSKQLGAEEYRPTWADKRPQRTINIEAAADPLQNGQRLVKAVESLKPGDGLVIGAGTYSIERLWDVTVSGTAERPLWIVAAKDAKVVLTRPDSKQNILNVGRAKPVSFVCLRGLEFTGGSHGIRLGACNDLWIDGCHIHHTAEVGLSANSADTQRIFLTRNTIHHTGGTAEGMYLGGNDGAVIMSESVIALNHVYECRGNQGDGIELKQGSWGNRIVGNRVHDCNYPCITVYGTAGKPQNIIERNVCYRSEDSAMQVQGEAMVRNNLLVGGKNAAFASTDHQGKTVNLQVVHNTLLNENHAFRGGSWNSRANMVLANNVIYSRAQNALHFPNGFESITITGNVLLGNGPKFDSRRGEGLEDFKAITWDADRLDASPLNEEKFNCGDQIYRLPMDLFGRARSESKIIAGAVISE